MLEMLLTSRENIITWNVINPIAGNREDSFQAENRYYNHTEMVSGFFEIQSVPKLTSNPARSLR